MNKALESGQLSSGKQSEESKKDSEVLVRLAAKALAQKKMDMSNATPVKVNKCGLQLDGNWVPSTKMNRLLKRLAEIRAEDPLTKTLVFSQFTSMLDLMEEPLKANGFCFSRYNGKIVVRTEINESAASKFKKDKKNNVMLMSLRCGSLGLNITEASRVIFLDIWWNPSVEDQAIDRAHRIGQKKHVYVDRLCIENTVEARILAMQDEKRKIAESALSGDRKSLSRLSVNDLKSLFGC